MWLIDEYQLMRCISIICRHIFPAALIVVLIDDDTDTDDDEDDFEVDDDSRIRNSCDDGEAEVDDDCSSGSATFRATGLSIYSIR